MNEIVQAAGQGPGWGAVGVFLLVVVVGLVAYWAGRKAKNHPAYFREKIETPLDAAARTLAAQGWTPAQIDKALTGWADRDLTSKVAGAYENIPPEIADAANRIAEYVKAKSPKA